MNSKLSERKTEKHGIRMLNCDGGLKVDENWMSAETSSVHSVARVQKINTLSNSSEQSTSAV